MRSKKNRKSAFKVFSLMGFIAAVCYGAYGLDYLKLDSLRNLYEAVEFSHGAHVEYVGGDCKTCHHYAEEPLPCKECHEPFTVYRYKGAERKTSLGLKGAYHGQCLKCHKEAGGPTGCEDCHPRASKKS